MSVIDARHYGSRVARRVTREYAVPGGVSPTMRLPTVTEILRRGEATTRDTFIADLRGAGPGPRRSGT